MCGAEWAWRKCFPRRSRLPAAQLSPRRYAARDLFQVGNVASDASDFALNDRLPRQRRADGVFQFVRRGRRTRAAQLQIPVVNSPVVRELMILVKDGDLRSNLNASEFYQDMVGIAQRGQMISVLGKILANHLRRFGLVGVDQPEVCAVRVARTDLLNHRSIAAGNRAVAAQKDEYDQLPGMRSERIHRAAGKIKSCPLPA